MGSPDQTVALIDGCYTLNHVPGKNIVRSLGLIELTKKGIAGDVSKLSEDIFQNLYQAAKEKGANAVVNVRLASSSYQKQGSQWEVSYIIAYGDAVIVE